jgi:hypothetical protein
LSSLENELRSKLFGAKVLAFHHRTHKQLLHVRVRTLYVVQRFFLSSAPSHHHGPGLDGLSGAGDGGASWRGRKGSARGVL